MYTNVSPFAVVASLIDVYQYIKLDFIESERVKIVRKNVDVNDFCGQKKTQNRCSTIA